ncbi:MAG: hypothetical protein HOP28_12540 [Gemmatimonadales bacterium]|nr:hypothetical protein [Gemmatimonadales bacterium]
MSQVGAESSKRSAFALTLLALLPALLSLANGFVYDDVPVILENPLVTQIAESGRIWRSSYWPAGMLYRPLTIQVMALEWWIGGGRALVFHALNVVLLVSATLLLFRLARRMLPPAAAFAAAALFAVHPVHAEVVGNVIGQSELLVAVLALIAVERYVVWRAAGMLTVAQMAALALLTLMGIAAKETGYVIPGLLVLVEVALVTDRHRHARPALLVQGLVAAAALLVRSSVLGTLAGETPTTALAGLGPAERAVAMLAVVPEWVRLLFWPARLQGEYGPPALAMTPSPGVAHLLGAMIVLAVAALLVLAWRRNRVAAFGVLWCLLGIAPVSNLLAPTGVVLAERTLFLPSVGFCLAVGAALAAATPRLTSAGAWHLNAAKAVLALVVAAGAVRSAARYTVWRSQERFFASLQQEAPRTYRAHLVSAKYYYGAHRLADAERAARRALTLYDRDVQVHEQLGQILRTERRCAEAVPILDAGVRLAPDGTTIRSRLIECALAAGDTALARASAQEAVARGLREFEGTVARLLPRPAPAAPPAPNR